MGLRAFLDLDNEAGDVKEKPSQRALLLGIDVPLLLITVTLLVFGLLMVYSGSWDFSFQFYGDHTAIFINQLRLLGIGILVAVGMALLNYHMWEKVAVPIMLVTVGSLVAVLLIRDERLGAVRSLFSGSVQPSELAKWAIVIYLSIWLYNRRDQMSDVWLGLVPLGTILGVIGGLIALQPDLSAVITIGLLGGMMFFLAGGDLRQILILFVLGFLAGFLVYNLDFIPTGKDRIDSFWAGLRDLMQSSDHVKRSLEAFIKGSWLGVGIGKAETKLTGLPFPHTDSIFAVVGEETGVFGSTLLVLLYTGLMWRGLTIARKATDQLGMLLAGGLSLWIVMEAMINMSVMVGMMPFAGNALPFISSGGSSLVASLAAIGIIMNVSRVAELKKVKEERTFNAVVDLRRWDRRRSVSRSRRSPGSAVKR